MLAIPPFWASSKNALLRANTKPPVELVVADLFYVGCSRAKKELTVFVSADKVKSYKQQFIDTFSKMGFEVCECKMGLPKN